MSDETKTVEIAEPVKPAEAQAPTVEAVKAEGWTDKEIKSAQERGLVAKEEEAPAKKVEPAAPAKADEPVKPELKPSSLPDFEIKDPAKEKVFLETFGPGTPQRAMYFRMKHERQARQNAEADVAKMRGESEALKARLEAIEKNAAPQVDADGNPVDPDNQPLTLAKLKELQKAEAEANEKRMAEQQEVATRVRDAQTFQEEFARSTLPNFDDAVEKAADLMKNLDALLPEKWKQTKAIQLMRDLQRAAMVADQLGVEDYNAAFIAYEIGQMHPEWGKKSDNGTKADKDGKIVDPKANGGLTPDQVKRLEERNRRPASSASVSGGGGKRTVNVEDVTVADINAMDFRQRAAFRAKHPERYVKLVRG
jgi:hypothetical protein